jgi:hypothetical protein
MAKRKSISDRTKLAATIRELFQIPYEHAKLIHEDQIISLVHYDHGILHAVEPIDEHWNLTPKLIADHRKKSKVDTGIAAKSKRTVTKQAAHKIKLAVKSGDPVSIAQAFNMEPKIKRKSKWPSRPFPKRK